MQNRGESFDSPRFRLPINLNLPQNGVEGRQPPIGAIAPDKQPLPEGKGLGVRDREIALLIKKIDFFDKLRGESFDSSRFVLFKIQSYIYRR